MNHPVHAKNRYNGGFTLVEMLVVVSIFVILSATLFFNYNKFDSQIVVNNKAQEIAQSVREAQVFAMGTKNSGGTPNVFSEYGLHFELLKPRIVTTFSDLNNNKLYDVGGTCGNTSVECVKQFPLSNAVQIVQILGVPSVGANVALSSVDVSFGSKLPDAYIFGSNGGAPVQYAKVEIKVQSTKGYARTIDVWASGQISVR